MTSTVQSGEVRGDRGEIDLDGVATQNVLDFDRAQLAGQVGLVGDELRDAGEGLDRYPVLTADLDHTPSQAPGGRGNGDQHLVRMLLAEDVPEVRGGAEHLHAVEAQVLLAAVVVDDPDRGVSEGGVAQHLLDDALTRIARADDDRFPPAGHDVRGRRALQDRAGSEPRAGDEREAEQKVERPHPDGHARGMDVEDEEHEPDRERGERHSTQDRPHVSRRYVSPPAVVDAGGGEDRQLENDGENDDLRVEVTVVIHRPRCLEAKLPGDDPGSGDQRRIDGDLPQRVTGEQPAQDEDAPLHREGDGGTHGGHDALLDIGADTAPQGKRQVLGRSLLRLGQ